MKFMKLGTRPDTFYTEKATRTVTSDVASDLVIQINNITFLLHKYPLLPKCGLLQRLCSDSDEASNVTIELHDIPGGEDAFELCAKFCYGITISLGAHNIVPALSAANFLRMTEAVEKGNFFQKLEYFLNTCILDGWKDSIATLQTTLNLPEWSENLGIIKSCIDSIVEKILTPPAKVTWSYTYTRTGYIRKHHQAVPKDWWTEDISDLDIELFRCIITAIKSINMLPPQLIGEALHVYACRWLPDTTGVRPPESSTSQSEQSVEKNRRILENISSMIPAERGSVSIGFLLRLLSIANYLGVSSVTKSQLVRRCSLQLEEATMNDLLLPSYSASNQNFYDIDLVGAVLESFLVMWKRQFPAPPIVEDSPFVTSIRKVGKLIDSYLQVVARDVNMHVSKVVSLAEDLPEIARPVHDDLYKAINIYLKEHPDLTKAEKKRLCRILDCQKLSKEVRAHVVKNERLPLRTVVQVLFFEQEGDSRAPTRKQSPHEPLLRRQNTAVVTTGNDFSKLNIGTDGRLDRAEGTRRTKVPDDSIEGEHKKTMRHQGKSKLEPERNAIRSEVVEEMEPSVKGRREIREENTIGRSSKLEDTKKTTVQRRSSDNSSHYYNKGREKR